MPLSMQRIRLGTHAGGGKTSLRLAWMAWPVEQSIDCAFTGRVWGAAWSSCRRQGVETTESMWLDRVQHRSTESWIPVVLWTGLRGRGLSYSSAISSMPGQKSCFELSGRNLRVWRVLIGDLCPEILSVSLVEISQTARINGW